MQGLVIRRRLFLSLGDEGSAVPVLPSRKCSPVAPGAWECRRGNALPPSLTAGSTLLPLPWLGPVREVCMDLPQSGAPFLGLQVP